MHAKDSLPVAGRALSQPVQRDPKYIPALTPAKPHSHRYSRLQRLLRMFTSG